MVMTVYKVSVIPDVPWLMATDKSYYSRPGFRGERMAADWGDLSFYIKNPGGSVESDFYYCSAGALVYSEKVRNSPLEEMFERVGEVLPARVEGVKGRVYFLNVLECYNCLLRDKSKCDTATDGATITRILEYAIDPNRILDNNLFKIPETKRVELYALSGRQDPEDEFYSTYHALKLKGLSFQSVWQG